MVLRMSLPRRCLYLLSIFGLVWALTTGASAQTATLKPEELAVQVLNAANRAYNEQQFGPATERYREYLKTYANQKDVNLARYGLALCLLEAPQKDYKGAIEHLTPVVGIAEFTER